MNEGLDVNYPDEEENIDEPANKMPRLIYPEEEEKISISSDSEVSVVIPDGSDDEVQEVTVENRDFDEVLPQPEPGTKESSLKTSEDSKETTDNIVTVEDSVDTTHSYKNSRKRKLDEPTIFEAETQLPLNTSTDTIEGDKSPVSMEIAYDASNTQSKVVVLEKLDDENLPSTNETDDVQITCGQTVVVSQEEPAKDTVEVEIEISAVNTKDNEIEETKENGDIIAANENNIEVKITSKEISVEDMLADFVDEVNEEPSLVA